MLAPTGPKAIRSRLRSPTVNRPHSSVRCLPPSVALSGAGAAGPGARGFEGDVSALLGKVLEGVGGAGAYVRVGVLQQPQQAPAHLPPPPHAEGRKRRYIVIKDIQDILLYEIYGHEQLLL